MKVEKNQSQNGPCINKCADYPNCKPCGDMVDMPTTPKTIREWLTELDEPWRTEALSNMAKHYPSAADKIVYKMSDALYDGVNFRCSVSGEEAWNQFFISITDNENPNLSKTAPPDLHALLKEILAEEEILGRYGNDIEAVSIDHIKAVFANHGITIDNEK